MNASGARIELTPEEIAERRALRRRLDREFGQPRAEVVPIDRAKKPLGLGIVLDDDERAAARDEDDPTYGWRGWHFGKDKDQAFLESAVSFAWLFHFLDLTAGALLGVHNDGVREINDLWGDVQREIKKSEAAQRAEQRVEVAELKATIAELKAEVTSLRAVTHCVERRERRARGERHSGAARTGRTRRAARRSRRRGGDDCELGTDAREVRAHAGSRGRNERRRRASAAILPAI
jgi:hypothetical protein